MPLKGGEPTTMKATKEKAEGERGRFLEAEENYRNLAEKIAPFVERRRFENYSTAGQWRAGSPLNAQEVTVIRAARSSKGQWR
jgi:hypothetical protein